MRPSNRSDWPSTTEHDRPFGNIVTIILIIVSSHGGESFIIRQDGFDDVDDDKDAQRGSTKCHRIDSLTIALIYGREGRSEKSGRRFGPDRKSVV